MSKIIFMFLLMGSLSLTACTGSTDGSEEEENLGTAQQAVQDDNGLEWNGLAANGLAANGLAANGLAANGLAANGLAANGLVMSALTDPLAQQLLKYIVSCALPANQQITLTIGGAATTFYGGLGLAPDWGVTSGRCDANCQAWVSGCVLSRVNYLGEHIPLSERGSASILASTTTERYAYPNREATYYGDIFSNPQKRFACTSPGSTLITRVCGPSTPDCIIRVVGDCNLFCDAPDTTEGSYSNCRDSVGNVYPGSITVFRQAP